MAEFVKRRGFVVAFDGVGIGADWGREESVDESVDGEDEEG